MKEDRANNLDLFRAVFENSTDSVVICDANGYLAYFNGATRALHGISESHLPPEKWADRYQLYDAVNEKKLKAKEVPLFRALQGETFKNVVITIRHRDGSAIKVSVDGNPLFDGDKKIGAIVLQRPRK